MKALSALVFMAMLSLGSMAFLAPTTAFADNTTPSTNTTNQQTNQQTNTTSSDLKCTALPQAICDLAKKGGGTNSTDSAVFKLLEWVIGILTAGVVVLAVAAFVYAGILYSSASDNAQQITKAKDIMTQTVIGLVVFALIATALEWLVPGGVF